MAANKQAARLKGSPTPGSEIWRNESVEVFHQPSESARQLWYYLRRVGKAKEPPSFRYGHHGGDGFLLHFMVRGKLWHRIRERTHVANPGEACLLDIGEDVSYGATGPGKSEFYWVLFNGKDMPRVFLELRADRAPIFPHLDAVRMGSLFRELLLLTKRQSPACEVRMGSLLIALLAELFACRARGVSFAALAGSARPFSDSVRKAIDRLTAYYDLPGPDYNLAGMSVKKMAADVGQSVSWFSRRFHREVGLSFKEYLNHYRIEQAKHLLETSDKAIGQIARGVGFINQNYFARQFTRIAGMPPREYRRIHQKRR